MFLFVVVFGLVFVGLSREGGEGLKLLWCAKPLVYCCFGASKGDTLCGFVFCFLVKTVLLKAIPFLFLVFLCLELALSLGPFAQELQARVKL